MTNQWRGRLDPLYRPDMPRRAPEPLASPIGKAIEPVLLVDDDADWCHECAFTLQMLGYEPIIALDPERALEVFLNQDVSIAIVDYNMPGQDGITLIQELTRNAEALGRKLHFIMATGYATKDLAVDAMRASAVDFLEKPIRQVDLQIALQRIDALRDEPVARDDLIDKMATLSDELHRLSRLIHEPQGPAAPAAPPPVAQGPFSASPSGPSAPQEAVEPPVPQEDMTAFIRDQLKKEARKREIGQGELFGDPAWEMLLDLLLAKIEDRQVSVSSACIASGAPMSTALRLVRRLVSEGVLFRVPDEHDRRRNFLVINPKFEEPLIAHLSEQVRADGKKAAG
ncbi:MAG: response regulator [Novosphingobium sp.]|nr:response regulator [Novosphingobium sp.]